MAETFAEPVEQVKAPKDNHCPCGCLLVELDELGYCYHLIGFSNDGRVVEPLQSRLKWSPVEKDWVEDGAVMVNGRESEQIQEGDILVNPEFLQIDPLNGTQHMAKKWVSFRVYNPDGHEDRSPIPYKPEAAAKRPRPMAEPVQKRKAGSKKGIVNKNVAEGQE